jgi:uncharacterized membrane protein YdfJ with MMPL/SSD domain
MTKKILSVVLMCCLISSCGRGSQEPPFKDGEAAKDSAATRKKHPKADAPFLSLNKTDTMILIMSVVITGIFVTICVDRKLRKANKLIAKSRENGTRIVELEKENRELKERPTHEELRQVSVQLQQARDALAQVQVQLGEARGAADERWNALRNVSEELEQARDALTQVQVQSEQMENDLATERQKTTTLEEKKEGLETDLKNMTDEYNSFKLEAENTKKQLEDKQKTNEIHAEKIGRKKIKIAGLKKQLQNTSNIIALLGVSALLYFYICLLPHKH